MVAAREAKGMSQGQLGGRIGLSQPSISAIESGHGSRYIPDVCRILKIPGPMHGWSEQQRQWAVIGHKLEERSPAAFKMALSNIQQILDELQASSEPSTEATPPKVKRPLRAMGSASVGIKSGPPDVTLPPPKKK